MEQQFEIGLKNDSVLAYTRMRYFLELIGIVFFCVFIHSRTKWYGIICFVLLFILQERELYKGRQKQKVVIAYTYGMLAFGWILINVWLALLHILLLALNIIATRDLRVMIGNEGINYPSFPKKNIQWNELQNVILKDGILTIDCKNDKLLQVEVDAKTAINETLFNQYCREQLK